jgi:hypothetical protein
MSDGVKIINPFYKLADALYEYVEALKATKQAENYYTKILNYVDLRFPGSQCRILEDLDDWSVSLQILSGDKKVSVKLKKDDNINEVVKAIEKEMRSYIWTVPPTKEP